MKKEPIIDMQMGETILKEHQQLPTYTASCGINVYCCSCGLCSEQEDFILGHCKFLGVVKITKENEMTESALEEAMNDYNESDEYTTWRAELKSWKACAKWIYEQMQTKRRSSYYMNDLKEICEIDPPKPENPMPEILPGYKIQIDYGHGLKWRFVTGSSGLVAKYFRDDGLPDQCPKSCIFEIYNLDNKLIWKRA